MTATAEVPSHSVPHLTAGERAARGKAARAEVPRRSHAGWDSPAGRRDPVDILEEQAVSRLPDLVPLRYGRMLTSAFAFYRGAAAIMAADLAATPRSGLQVQLCGDADLSNFGGFASPARDLVFDINDFDGTLPGPWEWDVKRLAASIEIAGRDRGFRRRERRGAARGAVRACRGAMRGFWKMTNLAVWYARLDVADVIAQGVQGARTRDMRDARRTVEKARAKDSARAVAKLTERVDGRVRIVSVPPLVIPLRELFTEAEAD